MKKMIAGIIWQAWHVFYWAPLFAGGVFLAWYMWKGKERIVSQLTSEKWRSLLLPHYSSGKSLIKMSCFMIAFVCLWLALMRPSWGQKEQMVQQEGRDVFVALDVSRSMLAADVKPNRLTFAKAKIKKMLTLLPSDRVGLLVFSGDAFVQCPLTRDAALFHLFLDQLDTEMVSSGTTSLDKAIIKAIESFKTSSKNTHKILILFTDGEDFSQGVAKIKTYALEQGLHIFTYGVGTTQGAPIPIVNQDGSTSGYEKNKDGSIVMSCLNEDMLKTLAQETGALYISPTQNEDDLLHLVSYVNKYEKEMFEDKNVKSYEERYPLFLLGTFLALIIEWLL